MEGDIREYQALARLGYNPGIADGIYDRNVCGGRGLPKEQNLLPTGRLDIPQSAGQSL